MTIRFRQATKADAEALAGLMGQLGYAHGPDGVSDNLAAMVARGDAVIVAEGERGIVGCVSAILDVRLAEGRCGEIVSLVVTQTSRGAGLGAELVAAAEAWLRPRTDRIRVRANVTREAAHAFYRRQGYRLDKRQCLLVKSLEERGVSP
ncbi:GNAT family N-acetyltransferase [Halomonas organivorans]|uniref:GNAT superfamily N-acetyltransferase n=1 Tax=Halomonas organivorans TaxID=257772 RepID=A0A7W5BWL6_9GAMM|nr:GNAT family N-acetyltransferase [Halomonas organivorans]MBB3140018.1 GNAT superfamily N-acetyltransferase [Halomonas organivorans]